MSLDDDDDDDDDDDTLPSVLSLVDIECVPNAECSTATFECTCKPGHYTDKGKCFPFKAAGERCQGLGQCTDFAECSSATGRGVCNCVKGYYNEAGWFNNNNNHHDNTKEDF